MLTSKLVRVEALEFALTNAIGIQFQFQTGAIRSTKALAIYPDLDRFQFQTGAIRREFCRTSDDYLAINLFQFQTGAIRSEQKAIIIKSKVMFQFQTGSIRSKKVMVII